jgi:DDE family transposase
MEKKYNDIYDTKIQPLFDLIINQLNDIGTDIFKYKSRINFRDLFYLILRANASNNASYSKAINDAITDQLIENVSKSAIIQKRQKCDNSHIKKLNNKILEFIYSDDVNVRILGTDGTFVYTVISLANEGVKKSNNNNCCKILVNVIYDVEKKIPISYRLIDEQDERSLLKNQFNELKKNDIVIHDGGYYSAELLKKYIDNNINAVFRISKIHDKLFKRNKNDIILPITRKRNNSKTFNKKRVVTNSDCPKARYIKFYADIGKGKKAFYLCTTLMNYTAHEIIEMYRKRWKIETYFKSGKEDISLNNIKSKSVNNVMQDIHINHFISIISSYIEHLLTGFLKIPSNQTTHYCKINTRNCIDLVSYKFIRAMLFEKYKNESKKLFNYIASSLINSYILVKKFRSYERIRKRPQGKWSVTGTSSHRPAKGIRIPVIKTNNGICVPKIEHQIKDNSTITKENNATKDSNIKSNNSQNIE